MRDHGPDPRPERPPPRGELFGEVQVETDMMTGDVNRNHALAAILKQDKQRIGADPRRTQDLILDLRPYSPSRSLHLAFEVATGRVRGSGDFLDGAEAHSFLRTLGFEIVGRSAKGPEAQR